MEKILNITENQLTDTVTKAVDQAKVEFAKSVNPFNIVTSNATPVANAPLLGAYIKCLARAKDSGNSFKSVAKQYNDQAKTYASEMLVKAINETTPGEGGYLVIPEYATQMIEYLYPASVIRSMAGIDNRTFSSDQLIINRNTDDVTTYWDSEVPSTLALDTPTFDQVVLTAKTLNAVTALTKDWIADASINGEQWIQDKLQKAIGLKEDQAFIYSTGAGLTPKGLYAWTAAGNIETEGGTTAELIEADLFTMLLNLTGNNHSGPFVWMMSPRTFFTWQTKLRVTTGQIAFPELRNANPTLMGYPVVVTNVIPNTFSGTKSQVYLFDPSRYIIADRQSLTFEVNPIQNVIAQSYGEVTVFAKERLDTCLTYDTACTILEGVS